MTCRGCQRVNDARRRYCGTCGVNLAPACPRCQFVNEGEDRYCGGCGDALLAAIATAPGPRPAAAPPSLRPVPKAEPVRPVPPPVAVVPPPVVVVPPAPAPGPVVAARGDTLSVDDLRELLRTSVSDASRGAAGAGVSQDDIDSLFGGVG